MKRWSHGDLKKRSMHNYQRWGKCCESSGTERLDKTAVLRSVQSLRLLCSHVGLASCFSSSFSLRLLVYGKTLIIVILINIV